MATWDHWMQRNDFYGWAGSLRFDSCGVLLSVLSVGFRKLDATMAYRTPNWTRAFKCVFSVQTPWNCSVKNEESIQRSSVQQISAWTKWWENRCTLKKHGNGKFLSPELHLWMVLFFHYVHLPKLNHSHVCKPWLQTFNICCVSYFPKRIGRLELFHPPFAVVLL